MNLLLGYYPPDKGIITIGKASTDEIKDLNSYITIMRQDPVLFNDTLRNNLCLYQDVPEEAMIEMLKKLNLDHFANKEGLDSLVLEGGSNFSGGERKRICLARTLLRKSPIIILDEPLANVDPETANQIADLTGNFEDTTLFVISHVHSQNWTNAFEHKVSVAGH